MKFTGNDIAERGKTMRRTIGWIGAALIGASMAACDAAPPTNPTPLADEPVVTAGTETTVELGAMPRVSELRREIGPDALIRDRAAATTYEALEGIFARGDQGALALGVYDLDPVPEPQARLAVRAERLGLQAAAAVPSASGNHLVLRDGSRELRVNLDSGSELLVDRARFHNGTVADTVLDEARYVEIARERMQRALPDALDRDAHAYKIRRYMNGVIDVDSVEPQEGVYQVAVAFNTTVDDLPVIGAGGKVAIHMTPAGEVISHESSVRGVAGLVDVVGGDELLSPDEALATAEGALKVAGAELDRFEVARSEFGYYRAGRSSVQSVIAPHYAFRFEPVEGVQEKARVELVPAVASGPVLERVEADRRAERLRKTHLMDATDQADER